MRMSDNHRAPETGRRWPVSRQVTLFVLLVAGIARVSLAEVRAETLGQGKPWQTSYYINDSGVDGPTVLITGGIHGNEPAGARAAEQIRHWPIERGRLIVIPRVNRLALDASRRFIPDVESDQRDLNRNFPGPDSDRPRGEIATALWKLVVELHPDWLFDLHEGYEFNISHEPQPGKDKSVGSSVIFRATQGVQPLVDRMLEAANRSVTDPDRRFVPLSRGPKATTLAAAAIDVLDARAMILETTFRQQRMPVRTRQHRAMMSVALQHLGMIADDCADILTPAARDGDHHTYVALYDDEGASENGVRNMTRLIDADSDMTLVHLGAADVRPEVLSQFDVVVFGGGSGSREAATIGTEGAEAVQSFVNGGGGYVGVCAGAYLCSAHYSWSLKLIDTHVFTGKREVEGQGARSMWYRGKSSTQTMQLTDAGRKLFKDIPEHVDVRYQNGPIVSPQNFSGLPAYTPLAYFRSEQVRYPPQEGTMIDTPAIVSGDYGEGRVISISPHPEATEGLESMFVTAVKEVARQRD